MNWIFNALIASKKYYLIGISLLGFSSGSVFTLVSFVIPYQLSEAKYTTDIVGSMFLTALPYCIKPLCAPFIDKFSIPVLCARFGHRRGWALATQLCLFCTITCFLFINPVHNLLTTAFMAFIISCCAATQDIVVDAYRIERPPTKEELSIAVTFSGVGFRFGILVGSVGALYISNIFGWNIVYVITSLISLIGPLVILNMKEPVPSKARHTSQHLMSLKQYFYVLRESLFALKLSHPDWLLIILFVFLYKASDSVPMAMSSPLFLDLSFSTSEIASISKAYGLSMMILGGIIGGVITSRLGNVQSIMICGTIQLLSPLMFMVLSIAGHDSLMFIITITIQNFCCGLGGTAIVIYLTSLCNGEFIATQFSIIASFSALTRISLSSISGFLAKHVAWPQFFLGNTLFSMLFIIVFLRINRRSQLA